MIALMMVAVQTSETLVNSHQSTQHYNPEGSHLNSLNIYNKISIPDFIMQNIFHILAGIQSNPIALLFFIFNIVSQFLSL
jgi:hypothetical protein